MGDPNSVHYTRSDGTNHVITGSGEDHGHIIYDTEGDVIYIRAEGTPHNESQYDVNKGDDVDHPDWPWPQGQPPSK